MRRLLLPVLLALTALASPSLGQTERILRFDSDITVHEDGSMAVRETVKVQAQGIEINLGINVRGIQAPMPQQVGQGLHVDAPFVQE